jgi:pyridoxal phosphate enzyme (YggS family)
MSVAENLLKLKNHLPEHVTLVAVSKTKPETAVEEAYEAGQRDFGENYVQELVDKQVVLPLDIQWHFIGHLQSNKVKYIAPFVHLIHGVDSFKLLKEINKQAAKINRVIDCLLQIFIAKEETKFGLSFEECDEVLAQSRELSNIRVRGFMAMASNTNDATTIRSEFRMLTDYHKRIKSAYPDLTILSFGMSSDYKIAIEEGSNMIRIGSTIFGAR